MSARKSAHPEISPRPLIGVARRRLDWKQSFVGKYFVAAVNFCRNNLSQNVETTLTNYFYIVVVCSLIGAFVDFPRHFYFVRKRNILNDYFVKWSWAWTLFLLGGFMFSSSFVYTARRLSSILRQLCRLAVATAFWYVCIQIFWYVERGGALAGCSLASFETEPDCVKNSARWVSFEISGHVFILTYIALITAEELTIFQRWVRLGKLLKDFNLNASVDENEMNGNGVCESPLSALSDDERLAVGVLYRRYGWLVGVFYVLNVLFSLLWLIMITITALYYHHFEQKIVAFLFAVVSWFVTYRVWYPTMYPGTPGFDKIKL